jgi:hypothetical protein
MSIGLASPHHDTIVPLAVRIRERIHAMMQREQVDLATLLSVTYPRARKSHAHSLHNLLAHARVAKELHLLALLCESKDLDQQGSRFSGVFWAYPDSHKNTLNFRRLQHTYFEMSRGFFFAALDSTFIN